MKIMTESEPTSFKLILMLALLLPAALACAGLGARGRPTSVAAPNPTPPAAPTSVAEPAEAATASLPQEETSPPAAAEPVSAPVAAFSPVPDAAYGSNGDVRSIQIPATECANLTATPILVGDWLVYPMHEHRNCEDHSAYWRTLFGYNTQDGKLYALRDDATGEAPLLYQPEQDALYWNVIFAGTVFLLDPQTFELRKKVGLQTTSDGGGVYLDGLYYFGTINAPGPSCQEPINPNCGGLFAIDGGGNMVHQRNTEDGFRAWIGTGLTTDGEYLYIGSAAQTVGEKSGNETEYLYGCSVIKAGKDLNIVASFDPGDLACYELPFEGANMDSVSGEVVPDGEGLWVQYVRPNDNRMKTALYRLNLDLEEQCRLEFDFEPQTQAVGFYTAPTVDRAGNAYIAVNVPDAQATRRGLLLQVTPACESTTLVEMPGSWAHASPTLADDQYVLFATDGRLGVYTLDGDLVREYALASPARVLTSPIIHAGVVYVLQEDGTLNIIENSGLTGYGVALWPRYRHDNAGSAALTSPAVSTAATPPTAQAAESQPEGDAQGRSGGAFITFHLEVSRGPRIRTLWPLLGQFIALADQYDYKISLQFSPQWADYVYQRGLLDVVHTWEENGHEIALHHHGPSHKFFDGYTNDPSAIRTDGWYFYDFGYQGDMAALMDFMAPLSRQGIVSAGMSDEDIDWPAGVLYFATDSGETPSKNDLFSTPVQVTHNGYPVVEIYNAGYAIDHLGEAAVTLAEIETGLQTAAPEQFMGLVFNDETIELHFEQIEPLFQLLQRYGVQVQTVRDLLEGT